MSDVGQVIELSIGHTWVLTGNREYPPPRETSGAMHMNPLTWQKMNRLSNATLRARRPDKGWILERRIGNDILGL